MKQHVLAWFCRYHTHVYAHVYVLHMTLKAIMYFEVACMSHFRSTDSIIHVHVRQLRDNQFCVSGSLSYLVPLTVEYPTCSDKWCPDK